MSAETKAALDVAIADHFADAWEGAFVTGYVLQMAGVTADDMENGSQTSFYREVPENQAAHVTVGLLDYSLTTFRHVLTTRDDND